MVKLSPPVSVGWAYSASLQGFSPGHGVGWTSHPIAIAQGRMAHQGEEGPQSGSVDVCGLELDSGGKQCCLIKALKASSLALSFASLAFSLLSCSVSLPERAGPGSARFPVRRRSTDLAASVGTLRAEATALGKPLAQYVAVNPERSFMPLSRAEPRQPQPKPMRPVCRPCCCQLSCGLPRSSSPWCAMPTQRGARCA